MGAIRILRPTLSSVAGLAGSSTNSDVETRDRCQNQSHSQEMLRWEPHRYLRYRYRYRYRCKVLVNIGTSTGILKVPVLVVFFDINMSGLKKHFWPHMQAGWGRTGHTFGLFFWPHVQPKVDFLPKLRYYFQRLARL